MGVIGQVGGLEAGVNARRTGSERSHTDVKPFLFMSLHCVPEGKIARLGKSRVGAPFNFLRGVFVGTILP